MNGKYCSRSCAAKWRCSQGIGGRQKGPSKLCVVCKVHPVNRNSVRCCSSKCYGIFKKERLLLRWKDGKISGNVGYGRGLAVSPSIRRYLIEKSDNRCSVCGWCEIHPITKKVPLTIDHIDGNSQNSSEENLRVLCPNCHSLTPSYGGLNRGRGRESTQTGVG